MHEVPRELADQVAARNPRRQPETLAGGIGIVDRDADLVEVGVRIERDDAVAAWRATSGWERKEATWTCGKEGGAPKTNRTCDLPLRRGLLYPLSYRGVAYFSNARRESGLWPP